ncbi:VOC family protein [Fictibacillus aquaticus]|uniref:Glyoxalase n=1 Tax=Fictibacillus aquaticus TaxID=2021314 RepID=A0A235FAB4_9BACL|nr:VOC family protein [Fictibacillus aquaticus]OYD58280.1 glyoxalase [Fictibacillus aquaticus]
MYEGIHHVSLLVRNINAAKEFYEEVLGFTMSQERPAFDFPGAWYDIGNTQLHLIVHEKGTARRETADIDSRDGHFAVRVNDMAALILRLEEYGVSFKNKPRNKTPWHQVFVSDPDGNLIEFNAPVSE